MTELPWRELNMGRSCARLVRTCKLAFAAPCRTLSAGDSASRAGKRRLSAFLRTAGLPRGLPASCAAAQTGAGPRDMMLLQRAGDPDIRRCLGLTALHHFDGKPATDAPTMPYSCQIQLHSRPGRHSTSERGLRLPLLIGGLLLALCGCAVPGTRSAMPLDVDVPATWSVVVRQVSPFNVPSR